jgi:hypothetical protein
MVFDVNGAIIRSSNSAVSITTNNFTGFNVSDTGLPLQNKRSFFYAQGSTGSNINFGSNAAWNTMIFAGSYSDNLGDYNTNNGRFTAPVTGIYHFMASAYVVKQGGTDLDYFHPTFWINGSFTAKQVHNAATGGPYRIRGRTYYSSGYAAHGGINDIFYLTAGDYVNYVIYVNASVTVQYYLDNSSMFCGYQIA